MNKKKGIQIVAYLYFAILIGSLFYLDVSLTWLGYAVAGGAIGGLFIGFLKGQFFGRIKPSEQLFNRRYMIEGIFWGLMILAVNLVVRYSGSESIDLLGILLALLVDVGIGLTIAYFAKTWRIQKQKERIAKEHNTSISCCDFAKLKDESDTQSPGYFVLTDDAVWFQSKSDEELLRVDPVRANPSIIYKTWFHIPAGLKLKGKDVVNLKFPYYWKSKIQELSS